MKVKNIIRCIAEEADLNILGATLLTIDEVKQLPMRLRKYGLYWWLRSPGYYPNYNAAVGYGSFYNFCVNADIVNNAVRPVLIIRNLESSNLRIGDTFEFGDKQFEIISHDRAFCLTDIGKCAFRKDKRASDANDYEKSDVKEYINNWFKKSINESNSEDKENEEIKEIKEKIDKLSKEIEKIYQIIY